MFRWINDFLRPYQISGKEYSILDKIAQLESRIDELEDENVNLNNALYEIANSLEARIDILSCEPYKLPFNTEKLQ
jgi:hypothetical protein